MKVCPRCSEAYPDDTVYCVADATPLRQVIDPLLGKTIAQRYRLISRLGAGGMSSVYLARHVMIDRLSAIKILRADLGQDSRYRDRFLREARAVNRINHENIVEITDYGEAGGLVYLVMEYIPGESLHRQIARERLSWQRMVAIGVQVASALGRAHQMGVIHRDLKPENLLLMKRRDGLETVKLTDFGIAKLVDAPALTWSEQVVGTPGYMAPEYVQFGKIDARADLYALGVVLYEGITGKLPYDARSQAELLVQAVSEDAIPIRQRAELPERLAALVTRLLARDADERPRDAFVVHDALAELCDGVWSPPPGPRIMTMPPTASGPSLQQTHVLEELPPASPPTSPTGSFRMARPAPDMRERPFAELAPLCREGLARVERGFARYQSLSSDTLSAIAEAKRLVASALGASETVERDQARIAELEARGREFKGNFGRALDELGRDASRASGWVATIEERGRELAKQREEASDASGLADVLLWEQAALEEEETRARAAARDLAFQVETLRGQLRRQTESFDTKLGGARAALEGHVGALRTLAAEAWRAIDDAATALGVEPVPSERPPAPS